MANQKGGGCNKAGRSKKKAAARSNPLSLFVRNIISAEKYFRLTKTKRK